MSTYSWVMIVLGNSILGCLINRGNFVRCRISATSAFRRSSSPSLRPDFKCVHTKQKLVWWRHKLIETAPCTQNPSFSLTTNSFILLHSTSPLCSDNQAPLHLPLPTLSLPPNSLSLTHQETHLVSKVVKNSASNTANFYIMDMMPEVWANPNCDVDANHLLAHNSQESIVPAWWRKHSASWRNWRCKCCRLCVIFPDSTRRPVYWCGVFSCMCQ